LEHVEGVRRRGGFFEDEVVEYDGGVGGEEGGVGCVERALLGACVSFGESES